MATMNLNLFRRTERDSGSAVKRAFAVQIGNFLDQVDGPSGFFSRRGDSLDDLFAWGLKVLDEKQKLEQQLTQCINQWQDGERKIHKLTGERDLAQSQFESTSISLQKALADLNQERMGRERERVETKHYYESTIDKLTKEHSSDMKTVVSRHKDDTAMTVARHKEEVRLLNGDIDKLVGQLLVNQNDSQAWPDDKLKHKFKELQLFVDSVTSPRHREFQIPQNQRLGPHLDPTNFLGRAGRGKSHFLLKSTIWAIFHEQFFKMPFGFGALGPGRAQEVLMNMYFEWLKVLDGSAETAPFDSESLAIFRRDVLANRWRSATFQSISAALTSSGQPDLAPVVELGTDNVNRAVNRIIGVLSGVSELSGRQVSSEVEDKVRDMAKLCFEIALQFGINTAQLRLSVPDRGEQITIGEEFQDCQDGDIYKGMVSTVDLVVVPGLQKIGDGRSEMTARQIVVPCAVYPELSNS